MIFVTHLFIKFSGSHTFFEKRLAPCSQKISTLVSAQLSKLRCVLFKFVHSVSKIASNILKYNKLFHKLHHICHFFQIFHSLLADCR
jgi:hypothetical protein